MKPYTVAENATNPKHQITTVVTHGLITSTSLLLIGKLYEMEIAKTRKAALKIESALLNKIAVKGVSSIADAVGVAPSQVTRWKESLIPRMSMLLAVLEWGVVDDDLARLAKQVAVLLTPKKKPTAATVGSKQQITMSF